jgi:hypothetical protein
MEQRVTEQFDACFVRISTEDGVPVGAGFLVSDDGHVLTCGHVVAAALRMSEEDMSDKPRGTVNLDFPFLGSAARTARVELWLPPSGPSTNPNGDVAVLQLASAPPSEAQSAHLTLRSDMYGHPFRVYGYPRGHDAGVWAYGELRDQLGNGWLQVEDPTETGRRIEQGFSGGPVQDQETGRIVGIVVATTSDRAEKVGFVIPTEVLTQVTSVIAVDESSDTVTGQGAAALTYRDAFVNAYSQIEVPGTSLSGRVERLFFWPTLQEIRLEDVQVSDYESEDPRYQLSSVRGSIDLRNFPNSALERAVIVAGAGFGKTVLLSAVGHRLGHTTWLPAPIWLPELADSGDTVVEFLNNHVNRRFDVSLSWDPYCNAGRAVLLFDGLDELTPGERRRVLGLIQDFSSRYSAVPWLLTVRDAKALAAPVDANVLKIDVFNDTQIHAFAEAYKDAGSAIDIPELTSQLRAFPDLRLLARIPLFLALLLATARPSEPLPRNRSELLEHYLHIVLHPEEYKPSVSLDLSAVRLREAAEQLAFEALEMGKTKLSETELDRILGSASTGVSSADYISDLVVCGLLQRSSYWLNFTFPIMQEYLAAHYLVKNYPDEVISRFELVARRPWTQTLQFAVEQHPEADQIIGELIEQPDDAFGTVLRLLGQCVVNGANVSAATKSRLGEMIGALWLSLPYPLKDNVGKLLSNGFTSPLPKSVRGLLEQARGLTSGGYEIVAACEDPDLTRRVLAAFLEQDLELSNPLLEMQSAVDDIAPTALQLYINRVKADHTTDKEVESLASLIQDLSPEHLSPEAYKSITDDTDLPPLVRLPGYFLGPQPLPAEALILAEEILRSPQAGRYSVPGWNEAVDALWRSSNSVERWTNLVCDESLTEERRDKLLFALLNSRLTTEDDVDAIERLRATECLTTNLEHTALLLKGYLNNQDIIYEVANSLQELSFENLYLWAEIIGKDPSEERVAAALRNLNRFTLSPDQKVQLSNALAFGLRFDVEMMASRGSFAGRTERLHPAASEGSRIVWEWADSYDGDVAGLLPLLSAAVELGHKEAVGRLRDVLLVLIEQQPESLQDHYFDHKVSNALRAIAKSEAGRGTLPLTTLRRYVEVSTSNAASQAVRMIASLANEEALETLIQLHAAIDARFVRSSIETSLDELAGRLGVRIVRDGDRLVRV